MHVAVRSSLTAGVALVGAGAMAVSPVSPAAPQMLTPTMQSVAVDLTAATNPVTAWTKVLTDAFGNTARIGGALVSDPAPVLRQVITNDVGYVTSVATGLASTIQGLIASATSSEPGSLGAALQTLIDDIEAGEYHQAGLDAGNLMFGVLMSAFGLISALEIPVTITQNIANAAVAAVGGLVTGAVLPAVGTLQGAFVAAGDSAQAVADALGDGDIADPSSTSSTHRRPSPEPSSTATPTISADRPPARGGSCRTTPPRSPRAWSPASWSTFLERSGMPSSRPLPWRS